MMLLVCSMTVAVMALMQGAAAESVPLGGPGIYTIEIPDKAARDDGVVGLASHLDLLRSSRDGARTRLSFLVASDADRADLEALAEMSNAKIAFESEATQELHRTVPSPDKITAQTRSKAATETIPGFPCYRNVAGTFRLMEDLVDRASGIASLEATILDIGDSYEKTVDADEGHDMLALKLTGHGASDRGWTTTKGIMYVTCGIHAREYATPELCNRWAEALVDGYGEDAAITSLLDHVDLYLVLQANPDGRVVAEEDPDLWWRKNTRPGCRNADSRGVDLNRNFPFKWGLNSGSSGNKCSNTYRGTAGASEPETQAIVEHMTAVFPASQRKSDPEGQMDEAYPEDLNVGVYVDVHSYGELIIWPWGHVNRRSPNDAGLQAAARKIRHFNGYTLSGPQTPDFFYLASGVTDEFAYGQLGAMGFTYELGTTFYQDCAAFENTIAPDNLPTLTYLASISSKPFALAKGPDVMSFDVSVEGPTSSQTVTFAVTASDRDLSAGPDDDFAPVTQTVVSVALTIDMHPDDREDGASPPILQLPVDLDGATVEIAASYALADLAHLFDGPAAGEHVAHVWAVDDAGYGGPVSVTAFTICSDDAPCPTGSPTGAPTPCAGVAVRVDLRTDDYPSETSWNIVDACQDDAVVEERPQGYFTDKGTDYSDNMCLPAAEYTFTILDSYGDGICCNYGAGNYAVFYEGDLRGEGGSFGPSASHTFGSCNVSDSTTSPSTHPSAPPSAEPPYYTITSGSCTNPVARKWQCKEASSLLGMGWKARAVDNDRNPGGCFVAANANKVKWNKSGERGVGCKRRMPCVCVRDSN